MVKIENEEKRKRAIRRPPAPLYVCRAGDNSVVESIFKELRQGRKIEHRGGKKTVQGIEFYIKEDAFDFILMHSYEMALANKEAMGFLVGEAMRWKNEYFVAYDAITAKLDSTSSSVKFRREAFSQLFEILDEMDYEYVIGGWYHSHPGYGTFMSSIDIETQKKYFNKSFHIAMVVDPLNMEAKAFKLKNSKCIEIAYAIF